jgi:hypothetical protein
VSLPLLLEIRNNIDDYDADDADADADDDGDDDDGPCRTFELNAMGSLCRMRWRSWKTTACFSGTLLQSTQLQPWQYTPAAQQEKQRHEQAGCQKSAKREGSSKYDSKTLV